MKPLVSAPSSPGRGMTLLEIILVSAILAVLLVMAVPVYQQYLLRTYRTQAVGELISMAACQAQQRASGGAYNTTTCAHNDALNGYTVSYLPAEAESVQEYQITALPIGRQVLDRCGSLTLDHSGRRWVSSENADRLTCWAGR